MKQLKQASFLIGVAFDLGIQPPVVALVMAEVADPVASHKVVAAAITQ